MAALILLSDQQCTDQTSFGGNEILVHARTVHISPYFINISRKTFMHAHLANAYFRGPSYFMPYNSEFCALQYNDHPFDQTYLINISRKTFFILIQQMLIFAYHLISCHSEFCALQFNYHLFDQVRRRQVAGGFRPCRAC